MTKFVPTSPKLVRHLLASPLPRILILGFALLVLMALNGDLMSSYGSNPIRAAAHIIAMAIAGMAVYIGYAHFFEQRTPTELRAQGMWREFGIGLLIGAGLYAACEVVLMALGIYRINGLNPWTYLLPAVAIAVSSSVFEELFVDAD